MMELKINIPGLMELAEALKALAGAKAGPQQTAPAGSVPADILPSPAPVQQPVAAPAAQVPPAPAPVAPVVPVPAVPTPAAQVAPVMPAAPVPAAVPTTVVGQAYTQDQLAVAMTGLVDQGRMQTVMDILARMGVQALTEVPKERYPELVLLLREAGAVI